MLFPYLKRSIHRTRLTVGLICLMALIGFPGSAIGIDGFSSLIRADLKKRIEQQMFQKGLVCQGEFICGSSLIPDLYIDRDYNPLWVNATGISARANTLISSLESANEDGLRNQDYHLPRIQELIQPLEMRPRDSAEAISMWTDLEILFSDAFLLFGSHLLGGRINPESLHPDWVITDNHADLVNILKVELSSEQFSSMFHQLRPPHRGYHNLRSLLRTYRTIADEGGWPILTSGPSLRKNDQDPRTDQLRRRLLFSGDLVVTSDTTESDIFDEGLEKAVLRFQARHGLKADGIVGKKTLAALNIPVEDQIRKIVLNLERWRWLPHDFGDRFILVNTADFRLSVIENKQTVFNARVVVGKPARQTPVFSSTLTYFVINPFWSVPTSIAIKDILPKVMQDPAYLEKNKFRIFSGWKVDAQELQPESIDWNILNMNYFPYHLRQDPGKMNALGRLKFMFPNKFSVYIHDTPNRNLFNETVRDFSSGCIRTENPVDLAAHLLSGNSAWTRDKLIRRVEGGKRNVVHLRRPTRIHLVYMTAWVSEDGIPQFREDIYNRDEPLFQALEKRIPKHL